MEISLNQVPAPAGSILREYLDRVQSISSVNLEGFYLTGSIPLHDYYPHKSDIDFIALLKEKPGKTEIDALGAIHHAIERQFKNPKLNGFYLTEEGLQQKEMNFPSFFEGRMHSSRFFELDQITLFELNTSSLHILGKPVDHFVTGIAFDSVTRQLHENMNSYWKRWIAHHTPPWPKSALLGLVPRLTEWGILGVARQLYTLETGKIASKLNAGQYYFDKVPAEFQPILRIAIETRKWNGTKFRFSLSRPSKTVACMKWMVDRFNALYDLQDNKT